jgi:hypothetical protein
MIQSCSLASFIYYPRGIHEVTSLRSCISLLKLLTSESPTLPSLKLTVCTSLALTVTNPEIKRPRTSRLHLGGSLYLSCLTFRILRLDHALLRHFVLIHVQGTLFIVGNNRGALVTRLSIPEPSLAMRKAHEPRNTAVSWLIWKRRIEELERDRWD